ncbi:hypothetical protein OLMES_1586 [Oleiphilus messinensis]|uniref:Immunity MXAN-0049 protein domain-containing protein n=2 Tax=Oleiphilus messinensis TaxID=141451 RepID=A0A1Y0I5G9_9GAMM|nr:hypothetical protein OLMES_1586 [Oleiphilus messinensis]
MIYRFLSKLAIQERLEAFPVPGLGKEGCLRWGIGTVYYEDKMVRTSHQHEIEGIEFFQAPQINTISSPVGLNLRLNQGKETELLPDIWGVNSQLFVSDRVKSVVEMIDTMHHEYIPIQWIDYLGKPIRTETNYYWFNQRRFLSIEPLSRIAKCEELGFYPLDLEEDFLARIIDTPSVRETLERLPIWQHCRMNVEAHHCKNLKYRCIVYLNQVMVDALRKNDVVGMDLFTRSNGQGEESLSVLASSLPSRCD